MQIRRVTKLSPVQKDVFRLHLECGHCVRRRFKENQTAPQSLRCHQCERSQSAAWYDFLTARRNHA